MRSNNCRVAVRTDLWKHGFSATFVFFFYRFDETRLTRVNTSRLLDADQRNANNMFHGRNRWILNARHGHTPVDRKTRDALSITVLQRFDTTRTRARSSTKKTSVAWPPASTIVVNKRFSLRSFFYISKKPGVCRPTRRWRVVRCFQRNGRNECTRNPAEERVGGTPGTDTDGWDNPKEYKGKNVVWLSAVEYRRWKKRHEEPRV